MEVELDGALRSEFVRQQDLKQQDAVTVLK